MDFIGGLTSIFLIKKSKCVLNYEIESNIPNILAREDPGMPNEMPIETHAIPCHYRGQCISKLRLQPVSTALHVR